MAALYGGAAPLYRGARKPHNRHTMEFKIRGVLVEIDMLETLDGQGWTFSRGIFFSDEPGPRKGKATPRAGRAECLSNERGSEDRRAVLGGKHYRAGTRPVAPAT